MDWARIMAPLSGGEGDRRVAAAALALAAPFGAELACVHAPADVADLIPWMGDGFMGGVQATAVESIRLAAQEGEAAARATLDALAYDRKTFVSLRSPVWSALAMEGRLSDVLVFDDSAARGKGSLAEAFQQIVANEQRPTVVARPGLKVGGTVAVAWDGGKEASRAMRTSLPLLQKAARVIVLTAPTSSSRKCDPPRLQAFLSARGVASEMEIVSVTGEAAPALLAAANAADADLLVTGCLWPSTPSGIYLRWGHPKLSQRRQPVAVHFTLKGGAVVALSRIVMRLARNPGTEFAGGDDHRGYTLVAPLTADGRLDARAYAKARDLCVVRRFAPDEDPADGRLTHRGARWYFDYEDVDEHDDEPVFRLGEHHFAVGEYVTVTDENGRPLTYKVVEVSPV